MYSKEGDMERYLSSSFKWLETVCSILAELSVEEQSEGETAGE